MEHRSSNIEYKSNWKYPWNHSFSVNVTDSNLCKSNDAIIISIKGFSSSKSIIVYPNPSYGFVNLRWETELKLNRIDVYDIYGKKVDSKNIKNHQQKTNIDLSKLAKGSYILHLIGDNFTQDIKILIN